MSNQKAIQIIHQSSAVQGLESTTGPILVARVPDPPVKGPSIILPFTLDNEHKSNRQSLKRLLADFLAPAIAPIQINYHAIGALSAKYLSYQLGREEESFLSTFREKGYVKIVGGIHTSILPLMLRELENCREMTEWAPIEISQGVEISQMIPIRINNVDSECDCPIWCKFMEGIQLHVFPNKGYFNLNLLRYRLPTMPCTMLK